MVQRAEKKVYGEHSKVDPVSADGRYLFDLFERVLLVAGFVRRDMHENQKRFNMSRENLALVRYALVSTFAKHFPGLKLCIGNIPRVGSFEEGEAIAGPEYHFYQKGTAHSRCGRLSVIPHVWLRCRGDKQKLLDLMPAGAEFDMWSPSVVTLDGKASHFEETVFSKGENSLTINHYSLLIEGYVMRALSELEEISP